MEDDSSEPEITEPSPKPRAPSRPWTTQEDALLRAAVAKYGDDTDQWIAIAAAVPGRTNKSCRKRWKHSLSPTLKKTAWSKEEDELLVKLHTEYPCRWSMIAKQISGRTDDACAKRYREALDPSIKQGEWTEEEDRKLLQEYRRWGGRWASVAAQLGRSGLGCRNRWRLLERKKKQAPSSCRSSSCVPSDKDSNSGNAQQSSDFTLKYKGQEFGKTQISEGCDPPQQTDQWGGFLAQLQHGNCFQTNSFASASNVPIDLNIPMDPSLSGIFDNTVQGPYQFDARLWDLMNGGCGCGCGSNQLGCSCGDNVAPPFSEIPTENFLDPFHQLSHSFPSIDSSETLPQSHLAPLSAHSVTTTLAPHQISIPFRPPEGHTIASDRNIHQHPASFTPFSAFGGDENSLLAKNGSMQCSSGPELANAPSSTMQRQGATSASPVHVEPIIIPENSPSVSSARPKRAMSPRTLAMLEDLPRQLQGDPVKFVAAIALTKVKDGTQTSCRCVGSCCAPSSLPPITACNASTVETKTLSSRKGCCSTNTKAGLSSPSTSSSKRKLEGKKRSRSPLPGGSSTAVSREAGSSAKRAKTKAPLIPRLSSHLAAVADDHHLLPYACGDPDCWRSDGDIRARFNTSGELLDHWRREHESGSTDERITDGKVFRCALEGCEKGWKSINGIQYHLQISRVHFASAMNKTVLDAAAAERQGSCSSAGEECQSPASTDAADESFSVGGSGVRKKHPCTHLGCPKVYKQAAGLKYHLTHGHPTSGPVQLPDLPPVLCERVLQGSRPAITA